MIPWLAGRGHRIGLIETVIVAVFLCGALLAALRFRARPTWPRLSIVAFSLAWSALIGDFLLTRYEAFPLSHSESGWREAEWVAAALSLVWMAWQFASNRIRAEEDA